MHRFILMMILLSLPVVISQSQETSDTGWEIIERCVHDPITPPDDWTFDGTILATGWAGIHGINANWDTPRILVFRSDDWLDILTSFSPDYQWFAVGRGNIDFESCPDCFRHQYQLDSISVYSTVSPGEQYDFQLNTNFEYSPNPIYNPRIIWYDANHIALADQYPFWVDGETFLWNPSLDSISELQTNISPLTSFDIYFPSNDKSL
ncbi:MAG: hypothetical protein AAFV93_25550, partial [Chloroflexota bacterium]